MINKAMILAAGLGTRMRPLSERTPKPLIKVDGKALIDHKLEAARGAGITTIIVNVHYLADQLEEHLSKTRDLDIIISDERDQMMDSGGGIAKALDNFGDEAFLVMNCDAFWAGENTSNLLQLSDGWNGEAMDMLLGLAHVDHSVGFDGVGDFFMDNHKALTRRGDKPEAPFAFSGDYILHPRIFHGFASEPFSSNVLFDRAIGNGRLSGQQMQGTWLHVGTPEAIGDAENVLSGDRSSR